ncbi:MAG: DUF4389 domain-containing protein [Gammaproteobacteria bacterium]|jgi:hypothetical protein|nr:DUF4389 domain-containing protein [Gammaproteobacteria bacterium]
MNSFKDNITDADFWLRLVYTLLFALAWQLVELLLAVILVLQIGFRLFTGKPHAEVAGLGNSLSQYAWQIGRYVSGASDTKPWPFIEWPAADAQWQPRAPEGPVTVDPVAPPAAAAPAAEVTPVAASAPVAAQVEPPLVEPQTTAEDEPTESEPPLVQPLDESDTDSQPEDKPAP